MQSIRCSALLVLLVGCGGGPAAGVAADRAERVTSALIPSIVVKGRDRATADLAQRMAHYRTPAVSIAVVDSGRVVWARAYGLKTAGETDSATAQTLFQAASISKPVTATAMLRLVDEGRLALDANVNSYLTTWKVPDNRFTAAEKVTLRRLVSHSAGLTIHGFPGYAVDADIPTVPQVLDGVVPANTAAVRVDTFPGAIFRYSGGGTTVMQQLLIDVVGDPFPVLMNRLVLDPVGMTASSYDQPLPSGRGAEAAAGHRADGQMIAGRWHVYPEMGAAGLWTTPTDLLKWAMAIAAARDGAAVAILSQSTAREMLTVQKGPAGLGPFLEGDGAGFNFGHGGANEGYRSQLVYFPETGQGAAVMANSDNGTSVIQEVLFAIAAEYGWPEFEPREIGAIAKDSAGLAPFVGTYEVPGPPKAMVEFTAEGGQLFVEIMGYESKTEAVFVGPASVVALQSGMEITFELDASGRAAGLRAGPVRARRVR